VAVTSTEAMVVGVVVSVMVRVWRRVKVIVVVMMMVSELRGVSGGSQPQPTP